MAALKRRNQRTGLERRVRPRIEKESEFDDEASSDAAQSSNESEDDNSSEGLGSDEESDNVRKSSL